MGSAGLGKEGAEAARRCEGRKRRRKWFSSNPPEVSSPSTSSCLSCWLLGAHISEYISSLSGFVSELRGLHCWGGECGAPSGYRVSWGSSLAEPGFPAQQHCGYRTFAPGHHPVPGPGDMSPLDAPNQGQGGDRHSVAPAVLYLLRNPHGGGSPVTSWACKHRGGCGWWCPVVLTLLTRDLLLLRGTRKNTPS